MQFSSVFTLLAIAMTAAAAPAEVVARTTITPESCTTPNYKPYCCQNLNLFGINVGALACTVGVLGGQCNNSVKCCKNAATNNGNGIVIINGNIDCVL